MKRSIVTATKGDKKSLMRFYKQQRYSAGLLGFDHVYLMKCSQEIIGAVIISAVIRENPQLFLHGLVIQQELRQQKLASQLIVHALNLHIDQQVICFSEEGLSAFYQKNGFKHVTEKQLLPPLLQRYLQYKKTNNKLLVFERDIDSQRL